MELDLLELFRWNRLQSVVATARSKGNESSRTRGRPLKVACLQKVTRQAAATYLAGLDRTQEVQSVHHCRAKPSSEAMADSQDQEPATACPPVVRDPQEDRYIHLVRLAWDLRWLGLETRLELPLSDEPCVVVQRSAGPLRVVVKVHAGKPAFAWGRGRTQWIEAYREDAEWTIKAAR